MMNISKQNLRELIQQQLFKLLDVLPFFLQVKEECVTADQVNKLASQSYSLEIDVSLAQSELRELHS